VEGGAFLPSTRLLVRVVNNNVKTSFLFLYPLSHLGTPRRCQTVGVGRYASFTSHGKVSRAASPPIKR
jgi:hypothetical protein